MGAILSEESFWDARIRNGPVAKLILERVNGLASHTQEEIFLASHTNGPDGIIIIAMSFASDDIKNSREILLAAFQQIGMKFTAEEMKDSRSIVLAAVQQDGRALAHAGEGVKNDA